MDIYDGADWTGMDIDDLKAAIESGSSELAAHPTMKSALMMRPEIGGDAVIGPFVEKEALEAQLSEMGRLAVQAGETLISFIPSWWGPAAECRSSFDKAKLEWLSQFYPNPG
jgi:hypothetical protein